MQISTSGYIMFGSGLQSSWPALYSITDPSIAPYWMNWDGCSISYVQLTAENYYYYSGGYELFYKVKNILGNYGISFVFLIQWADCAPFPKAQYTSQSATFQLTLASDGRNSYAIINYPYGKSKISEFSFFPMQVGYFDGSTRAIYISKNWQGKNMGNLENRYNLDLIRGIGGIYN